MLIRSSGKALIAGVVASAAAATVSLAQSNSGGDMYTHSVMIERGQDDVWAALVTKSIVDGYYFAPISDDIGMTGQDFFYGTAEQKMIIGSVVELRAPAVFKHSFQFAGPDQADSTVTYSLTHTDGQTRVSVTHEGYDKDTQSYADIAGGWPIILQGLKAKLEAN